MIYFKNENGEVFAYETQEERDQYGAADLVSMTQEEIEAHLNPVQPVVVPDRVTMRQARLALLGAGLLKSVEDAIDGLTSPTKEEARIEWGYASEVHRGSEFVGMMGATLSLNEEALDALFVAAAGL